MVRASINSVISCVNWTYWAKILLQVVFVSYLDTIFLVDSFSVFNSLSSAILLGLHLGQFVLYSIPYAQRNDMNEYASFFSLGFGERAWSLSHFRNNKILAFECLIEHRHTEMRKISPINLFMLLKFFFLVFFRYRLFWLCVCIFYSAKTLHFSVCGMVFFSTFLANRKESTILQ